MNLILIFSYSSFGRHGFTTQIHSLPGGVKREKTDIKDDAKIKRKNTQSYFFKLEKDFSKKENNEFLTFVKKKFKFLNKKNNKKL